MGISILKYSGGLGEYCSAKKTMEYLITTEDFNKRYSKKITKLLRGNGIKLSRQEKKTRKAERKQRLYLKRIPKQYKVYIKSIWWTKRKNKYYQENKRVCAICGSANYCDLHHLAYRHNEFGLERDSDLVCLCRDCHEDYHLEYGVSGNMHDSFAEFCASRVNNPVI